MIGVQHVNGFRAPIKATGALRANGKCPASLVTKGLVEEMISHALDEYPRESCGIVRWSGDYIRYRNLSQTPLESFKLPDEAMFDDPAIIVHSHPEGDSAPSLLDMQQQLATNLTWGIISVQGKAPRDPVFWGANWPITPLLGRPFVHGVWDCYSLIRDWFWLERRVNLPEFPREMSWWFSKPEQDFYDANFRRIGFEELPRGSKVEVGDVFFAYVHSKVVNHGGIYVGNDTIIHHLQNQLSKPEPVQRWLQSKLITRWVRYGA